MVIREPTLILSCFAQLALNLGWEPYYCHSILSTKMHLLVIACSELGASTVIALLPDDILLNLNSYEPFSERAWHANKMCPGRCGVQGMQIMLLDGSATRL